MGYKDFNALEGANGELSSNTITIEDNATSIDLPDASFVKDAELSRDGMDLILNGPKGEIIIEDYFAQSEAPTLIAPEGLSLSPHLVNSFVKSNALYADSGSMSDESPIGAVQEINGDAHVTRTDGTTEPLQIGAPIYQGDVIETSSEGAVNIMFIDETSFAVSEDARLAIDEYVFDPATAEGVTNFSVLKGMFVFTSGLIGREDPDDVHIETPVGSIGIRGTIIAGDVDQGEITVVEGAIVLNDNFGNEITLANQFETAKFDMAEGQIQNLGQRSASDVAGKFVSISNVSPNLFSSIDDVVNTQQQNSPQVQPIQEGETLDANQDGNVDGTVDQNSDGAADGTLDGEIQLQDGQSGDVQDGVNDKEGALQPVEQTRTTLADDATTEAKPALAPKPVISNTLGNDIFKADGQLSDGSRTTTSTTTTATKTVLASSGETTLLNTSTTTTKLATSTSTRTTTTKTIDGVSTTNDLPSPTVTTGTGGGTTAVQNFGIQVTAVAVDENFDGGLVARVSGVNGSIGTLNILGGAASAFHVQSTANPNIFEIYLNAGNSLNFEKMNGKTFNIQATSGLGASASQTVTLNINDIAENPFVLDNVSDAMFNASNNQSWSYTFRDEFFDADAGQNATLTFDVIIRDNTNTIIYDSNADGASFGAIAGFIDNGGFNTTTGELNINFLTVGADNWFSVEVIATDIDGLATSKGPQVFNVYQPVGDGTFGSMTGSVDGGDVMSIATQALTFNVSGANNNVFFSNANDVGIELDGTGGLIHTGGGEDSITIDLGTGYDVSGGNDNDSFLINRLNNNLFGDAGSDSFNFQLHTSVNTNAATMMSNLMNGSGGYVFNGGAENAGGQFFINFGTTVNNGVAARSYNGNGDSVFFSFDGVTGSGGVGGTIDFSAINNSIFKNIEILDFDNSDANDVFLNYQDVFDMTDNKKTLVIRGDSGDTVTFDTQSQQWQGGGQITDEMTGDVYDTYFAGDVTVLIDTDVSQVVT